MASNGENENENENSQQSAQSQQPNNTPKNEPEPEKKGNLDDNGGSANVLKAREDNKVSADDHTKCEEAFGAANIDSLDDDKANVIHKYEHNLIKMARNNEKDDIIEIASERLGLHKIDAKLLARELIDRFGPSGV